MRVSRAAAALPAVAVVLAVAGCGGSSSPAVTSRARSATSARGSTTTHGSTPARTHTSPGRVATVSGPPIGTHQTVNTDGADLAVTVLGVLTLRGTHTPALPGTRQVGVQLRIANQAGQTYDSTSSGDVSLVLSHGSATPLDVRAGACTTPLVDFESEIVSGDVRVGCVAFSVPRSARVRGVRFSPHSRAPGTLSWRAG